MILHWHEHYISYFSFFSMCFFFFTISKQHFVNQHILLKSSVENTSFGDKEKVLIAETYMEKGLS